MLNEKLTKVEAVIEWLDDRIDNHIYLVGHRIPSIRKLSEQLGVSPTTVTQAYERMVIKGSLIAKRGAGYFVTTPYKHETKEIIIDDKDIDSTWLMNHLFSSHDYTKATGNGTLPNDWLRFERLPSIARNVAGHLHKFSYQSSHTQGFIPLRKQYGLRLESIGIPVSHDELITTDGVSSAMTMITRYLLKPGDVVIVDNPCWFWLLANLQIQGVQVYGVNRDHRGPDIEQLRNLLHHKKAKIYLTNSVLHNPTGYNVHPSRAYQVLNLLHEYDAYLIEDDIYSFFDSEQPALRYAALDRERVFYATGLSKVIGMDWRQGILCAPPSHFEGMLQYKMLTQMQSSTYLERTVLGVLSDTAFRKHSQQLKQKLYAIHENLRQWLPQYGFTYPEHTHSGFFLWLDTHCDSAELALQAKKMGYLIAPGQLFSPRQERSTHIRLNVARTDEEFIRWLAQQKKITQLLK